MADMNTKLKIGFGTLLLMGLLAVAPVGVVAEEPAVAPVVNSTDDLSPAGELALWNSIKDTDQADNFLNYLNKFPNGMFFDPAKSRYELLSGKTYVPDSNTTIVEPAPKPADTTIVKPENKPAVAKVKTQPAKKVTKKTSGTAKSAKLKKKPNQLASVQSANKKKAASTKSTCKIVKAGQKILYYNKSGCPVVAQRKAPIKRSIGGGGSGSGGGTGGGWGG